MKFSTSFNRYSLTFSIKKVLFCVRWRIINLVDILSLTLCGIYECTKDKDRAQEYCSLSLLLFHTYVHHHDFTELRLKYLLLPIVSHT